MAFNYRVMNFQRKYTQKSSLQAIAFYIALLSAILMLFRGDITMSLSIVIVFLLANYIAGCVTSGHCNMVANLIYLVLILVLLGQGAISMFASSVQGWVPWKAVKNVDSGLTSGYSSMMALPAAITAK